MRDAFCSRVHTSLATGVVAALLMTGCNPSTSPSPCQTQEQVAAAVRAELRTLIPHVGTNVNEYREGLRYCGAILDGSENYLLVTMRFEPDDQLISLMPTGYLAQKKSQGWTWRTERVLESDSWVLISPEGLVFYYDIDGTRSARATAQGPCLPKSAGMPTTQGWPS